MEEHTKTANKLCRDALDQWTSAIQKNVYSHDKDLIHTIRYFLPEQFSQINAELNTFGHAVATRLEALVSENNLCCNLPRLKDKGTQDDPIQYHTSYTESGKIIYNSNLMEKFAKPGGLAEGLSLFFLAAQAGETGHNCAIASSASTLRIFNKIPEFPNKDFYIKKLTSPDFSTHFTAAQSITEIQGGSDIGINATYAKCDNNQWHVFGEKWFCANASANLILVTARFDEKIPDTKGLGLFLVPALWKDAKNNYQLKCLKDKSGMRAMATAELQFNGAEAIPMGALEDGFRLVMKNVLHLTRIFNSFAATAMARRAYTIAREYAQYRMTFSMPIIKYPLIVENLARIKTENTALLAGNFAIAQLQDIYDKNPKAEKKDELIIRLLVNIQKYLSTLWSVHHIHHALDVLAGNGTIENFSSIPRLLRDSIACENMEGTHNTLRMQVLKDIYKYEIDQIYFAYMYNEINKLESETQYALVFAEELKRLEKKIAIFKSLDFQLQALQIRCIVDRMGILFCGLRLLIEGIDQVKTESASKLDCFEYYTMLHLGNKELAFNHNYLTLIGRIV